MLVLLVGFGISLLGQLPLGNMNLAATQMGVQESYKNAWLYGLGIAIIEMIYLRISLTGMNWITSPHRQTIPMTPPSFSPCKK